MNWPLILAVTASATALAMAARRKPKALPGPSSGGEPIGPDALRELFERAEAAARWPNVSTFLLATSWSESRWHPKARSSDGEIGLFQLKPKSARIAELGLGPDVLSDPAWSTALYLWYLARLRNYAAPGQVIDWIALRRGGAYPSLVADVNESFTAQQGGSAGATGERSAGARGRFETALQHIGVPISFERQPAFPPAWKWPGVAAIADALGLKVPGVA